jgi:hypothetical protein
VFLFAESEQEAGDRAGDIIEQLPFERIGKGALSMTCEPGARYRVGTLPGQADICRQRVWFLLRLGRNPARCRHVRAGSGI